MTLTSIALAFLAGLVSILSPCVLPIVPLLFGAAIATGRGAVAALAAGLALSFVVLGLFVATIGFSIGLEGDMLRAASAVLLAAFGLVLLFPALQDRFAAATGGAGSAIHRLGARIAPAGAGGQFVLGLLLGAAWSPCVGPTLGAASVLAAQGQDLGQVGLVMLAFGFGAAVPLLTLGLVSREAMARWRGRMLRAGQAGKRLLGAAALAVAVLILSGLDRALEVALVAASPAWLTALTTRY